MMGLLGSYGSDEDADEEAGPQTATSSPTPASSSEPKRRKIDYAKLPVSRPLSLDEFRPKKPSTEDAPLRQAAAMESARQGSGKSLLAAIPAPKVTLGKDTSTCGSLRIDLSEVIKPKEKSRQPVANLLRGEKDFDNIQEDDFQSVPANMMGHKMFNDVSLPVGGGDGPTQEELEHMRSTRSFTKIAADDIIDPNWYMNNQVQGLHPGTTVPNEVSNFEQKTWTKNTMANPNGVQKRKHQINWLANEAMAKEAEMLDRNASSKMTKSQTSMKYGW